MIIKIETPQASCTASILYNEKKVTAGVADLVGYAGLEDTSRKGILDAFERIQNGARFPVKQVSFHASVNPSEEDDCSEEQVLEFITGLMDHLGYGDQPYLVYRHYDIEREHYHIVSTRIDRDGHKINNLFEIRSAREYMHQVEQQYGFSMVQKGARVGRARSLQERGSRTGPQPLRFNPSKETFSQLEEIWEEALGYDFKTLNQLVCILEDMGVRARVYEEPGDESITLQGLTKKGEEATEPISEEELGKPLYRMAMTAIEHPAQVHEFRHREKERVRNLVGSAFDYSRSEAHFRNILHLRGIGVHVSATPEGVPFGITFVDHTTKTVFKASELGSVISVQKMQEAVSSGRWRKEDRGQRRGTYIRMAKRSAETEARVLKDRKAGVIARVLTPIGQPRGNSWSGRTPKTEEQKQQERQIARTGALDTNFEDTRFEEKIS